MGGENAGLQRVRERRPERLGDKHIETPTEPGKYTGRYQDRDKQVVETFAERDRHTKREREGGEKEREAELHPETWRTQEGRASHAHRRVHRPTPATHGYTLLPPSLRRFPPTKPSYNLPGGSR